MRSLISAIAALLLAVSAFADGVLQNTGIKGIVTVARDSSQNVLSVTVTNEKGKSYTITPGKAVDQSSGKNFRITQSDIDRIAKYEKQVVQLRIVCWNGKVVEVNNIMNLTGEARNKI